MKKILLILFVVITCIAENTDAQIFKGIEKRIGRSIERTIENRVDREVQKKTDAVLDEVFDEKENEEMKSNSSGRKHSGNHSKTSDTKTTASKGKVNRSQDFESGKTVIFDEHFQKVEQGDFPGTWNTNLSGEVVSIGDIPDKWLKLDNGGVFTPDGITQIPENSTLEFDLFFEKEGNILSQGIRVCLVEVENRKKDFAQWYFDSFGRGNGKNGIRIALDPTTVNTGEGDINLISFVHSDRILSNHFTSSQFSENQNQVHIGFWRQKTRFRMYMNGEKILDLPRAFDPEVNYNSFVISTFRDGNDQFYISNIRLANAGADHRHKLLETGNFSTNEILFESGKATLHSSSFKVIDEIGEILENNTNKKLRIVGHTDSDGSVRDNQVLSEQRAESVRKYLLNHFNISSNKIETEGRGELDPIDNSDTTAAKSKNRRVEFILF